MKYPPSSEPPMRASAAGNGMEEWWRSPCLTFLVVVWEAVVGASDELVAAAAALVLVEMLENEKVARGASLWVGSNRRELVGRLEEAKRPRMQVGLAMVHNKYT